MKNFFSNVSDYIDKKKAEKEAETMAWNKVREDIARADAMFDVAAQVVADGWSKLEASCHIKDPIISEALADYAVEQTVEGSGAEYEAGEALSSAEAAALALAKGNHKVMLRKIKNMPKP